MRVIHSDLVDKLTPASPRRKYEYGNQMRDDYIEYDGRFERFHDMDIWTLRHFLREKARSTSLLKQADHEVVQDLYRYIEGWDWDRAYG